MCVSLSLRIIPLFLIFYYCSPSGSSFLFERDLPDPICPYAVSAFFSFLFLFFCRFLKSSISRKGLFWRLLRDTLSWDLFGVATVSDRLSFVVVFLSSYLSPRTLVSLFRSYSLACSRPIGPLPSCCYFRCPLFRYPPTSC